MKLSLSGRIAEDASVKDRNLLSFAQLAEMAAGIGYQAVCIRPSQVTVSTSNGEIRRMRDILEETGLEASMVCLDPVIAANTADAGRPLQQIERHLEIAEILGAPLIRVGMKSGSEIPWAQRAADQARERGLCLVHQTHTDSPFETVDACLEVLSRIDRPNFGLTVEPANLVLCLQDYDAATLQRLSPYIFNVYIQNLRLNPNGSSSICTNQGEVRYDRLAVGDEGGIDFDRFFDGLRAAGYDGYVTSHQPAIPGRDIRELAQDIFGYLSRRINPNSEITS
ncbi:MAG: sugar phosphate isomerase/epimerase [Chloroflexi bacterium]|nr:sugar phosphate isomerase/epimerase [Chloroflexota bacterium]